MNSPRDEEIAASVGAHRDLGSEYDDAIAAGLVERPDATAAPQTDRLPALRLDPAYPGGNGWSLTSTCPFATSQASDSRNASSVVYRGA